MIDETCYILIIDHLKKYQLYNSMIKLIKF